MKIKPHHEIHCCTLCIQLEIGKKKKGKKISISTLNFEEFNRKTELKTTAVPAALAKEAQRFPDFRAFKDC